MNRARANVRLPPEVNRVLYVRNLPYKITAEEMWVTLFYSLLKINVGSNRLSCRYDIFGKYGAIRQIRVGNTPETRGTAFVIYEDIFDAKNACDHLSGFNVCNRCNREKQTWDQILCAGIWLCCTTRQTKPLKSWTLRKRRQTCRRWRRNTTWTPLPVDLPWSQSLFCICAFYFTRPQMLISDWLLHLFELYFEE